MSQIAMHLPDTVQSVVQSRTNGPLIAAAAQLWINNNDRVLDMTYGRGKFWTDYRSDYMCTNDINPNMDAHHHEDFRTLPFDDGSFDVAVFDPPYIVMGGRDTPTTGGKDLADRFGLVDAPTTVPELVQLFIDGMAEARRVLRRKGILLVKCQDFVSSGGYVAMRHLVVAEANLLGFRQVDEFVHYSGTGPQPSGRRQHHSRRAHSFLCVFQSPTRKVEA